MTQGARYEKVRESIKAAVEMYAHASMLGTDKCQSIDPEISHYVSGAVKHEEAKVTTQRIQKIL